MFGVFKKGYATLMMWVGQSSYDIRYDSYTESMFYNSSVAKSYSILNDAYTNIEFKTFKKIKENIDGKEVYKFVPSGNKIVNNSLDFPSKITSRTNFLAYMLFYSTFGGRFLLEKQSGYLTDSLLLYSPISFEVEYSKVNAMIDKITIAGVKEVVGADLEKYHIYKELDPKSVIAGTGAGATKLKSVAGLTDLLNFMLKHNVALAKNKGSRAGFFKSTSETKMTEQQRVELESKMKSAIEGYQNAGKIGVLPSNVDFVPTDVSPKDLDWIAGWELCDKMVAGVLGVPLSMISDASSTYNNSKEDKVKLYKNTVIPIAKRHAEFLTSVFRDRLAEDEFVWIDLSTIEELRAETMETMKSLESVTYLTVNEKRNLVSELTGVEIGKYKHENADKILVNMGLGTLDEIDEVVEPVNEEE